MKHLYKNLIPLKPNTKEPMEKMFLKKKYEDYDFQTNFMMGTGNTAGVLKDNIVVVDIDTDKLSPTDFEATYTVKTPNGYHLYYKTDEKNVLAATTHKIVGVELKHLIITIPPSIINGLEYKTLLNIDVAFLPEHLKKSFKMQISNINDDVNFTLTNEKVSEVLNCLLPEDFYDRNNWFRLMCTLHNLSNGFAEDEFVEWSTRDFKYQNDADHIIKQWRSLKNHTGFKVGIKSLFFYLNNYGGDGADKIIKNITGRKAIDNAFDLVAGYKELSDEDKDFSILALECLPPREKAPIIKEFRRYLGYTVGEYKQLIKDLKSEKESEIIGVEDKIITQVLRNFYDNGRNLMFYKSQWFVYDNNYFKNIAVENIKKNILKVLPTYLKVTQRFAGMMTDIMKMLEPILFKENVKSKNKIAFVNKTYNFNTGGVENNDRDNYMFNAVDYTYDAEAKSILYDKVVREILVEEDKVRHFEELMGYVIQSHKPDAQYIIFQGCGANGKSVLRKLVTDVVGVVNTVHGKISKIDDRFSGMLILNKLLWVDDDVDINTVIPDGALKALSENKDFTGEVKGGKYFNYVAKITPLMICNNFPKLQDISFGLQRRANVFTLTTNFLAGGRADLELSSKLLKERSGIFNRWVTAYGTYKKRGYFLKPEHCKQSLHKWLGVANPLYRFSSDSLVISKNTCLSEYAIYARYKYWCRNNNHSPLAISSFSDRLGDLGFKKTPLGYSDLALKEQ